MKEYFPVSVVVPVILEIYQTLLSVRFKEVKKEEASTWFEEVQMFEVWQEGAKDETGFVGYCYLDLFPRGTSLAFLYRLFLFTMVVVLFLDLIYPTLCVASKYSHAAVWPLLPGYQLSSGKRQYPIAAMVANLAKPTPDRPALMRHDDVVTFFHEMGHVFHGLLSKTQFARFHGTRCVLLFLTVCFLFCLRIFNRH